jgi:phenylacetate-coenzyme A ligase PaaK-like adenylate-forming protein
LRQKIFHISNDTEFNELALHLFHYQYQNNAVYQKYCNFLNKNPQTVNKVSEIPFLPVEFFKTQHIYSSKNAPEITFTSSGTTGKQQSKHFVADLTVYETSFLKSFELFYGNPEEYCFFALLPSYLEREGSSLIYMAKKLIEQSKYTHSGFYLYNHNELIENIRKNEQNNIPTILLGVTFALLDLAEKWPIGLSLKSTHIIETGGMKGRRKEMIREELHDVLKQAFNVKFIGSEYGMTELLSQAYLQKDGYFHSPPWMKIFIRDVNDPFTYLENGKTGGINIIDLANIYSCSFIETKDLGKVTPNGFEVLGRFDNSDIRGCNLLVQ